MSAPKPVFKSPFESTPGSETFESKPAESKPAESKSAESKSAELKPVSLTANSAAEPSTVTPVEAALLEIVTACASATPNLPRDQIRAELEPYLEGLFYDGEEDINALTTAGLAWLRHRHRSPVQRARNEEPQNDTPADNPPRPRHS